MIITEAIRWSNDNVMVFDDSGNQITELQGRCEEVKDAVLAEADEQTKLSYGVWRGSITLVSREDW